MRPPLLSALVALSLAASPAIAQVPFDTFDDGDLSDITLFSGSGTGIGIGLADGEDGTASAALSVDLDPGAAGGFAGFVIPGGDGVTDVSAQRSLSFFLRPTTVEAGNLPLTLEINLHEDVDGNGTYEGETEDEFQAAVPVEVGSGYQLVQIPLADFTDDNSTFPGAGDGFDYSRLLEVVVAIGGPTGPAFTFAMDDLLFTMDGPPPPPPVVVFESFDDGNVGDIFPFSENGAAGIAVSPVDDPVGTPGAAINVGVDPSATGSFAGFAVTAGGGVTDVSGATAFEFQIRPIVEAGNLPLTLEINLHEDVDGDGTYEGETEDEFRALYSVAGASGYIDVSIPISAFEDVNTTFPGADDGFDLARLLEVVVVIPGPMGPGYALSFDSFTFPLSGSTAAEPGPDAPVARLRVSPNPTAGPVMVSFDLASASDVTVDLVDLLGRRVARLARGWQAAGPVQVTAPTASLSPGLYVVRVNTSQGQSTTRFTVAR